MFFRRRVGGVRPHYRVGHVHYPEEHRDRDSAGTQDHRPQYAGVPALLATSKGDHVRAHASNAFGSQRIGPTRSDRLEKWEAASSAGQPKVFEYRTAAHQHGAREEMRRYPLLPPPTRDSRHCDTVDRSTLSAVVDPALRVSQRLRPAAVAARVADRAR